MRFAIPTVNEDNRGKMKRIVLTLMIWIAFNGSTPKEYLEVYGKEDLPLKLEEKKVEYRCVDLVYSSEGYTKKCYVTKSSADKIDGW